MDLCARDIHLSHNAFELLKRFEAGQVDGRPLHDFGQKGDLSGCLKLYFGAHPGEDTHRIVLQEVGSEENDGVVYEIIEVVAIGERDLDYIYMLAAQRLETFPENRDWWLQRVTARIQQSRAERLSDG